MEFIKPTRLLLSDQIIATIEENIKNGNWRVGEKIPGEMELMKMFGVSRNTIRETIKPLVYTGILQAKQGDGTYIVASNALEASLHKRYQDAQFAELMEVRFALETKIVRFAALRRTEDELASLCTSLERRNTAKEEQAFLDADCDFHTIIAEMAHNSLLFDLYNSLFSSLNSFTQVYLRLSHNEPQNQQHTRLFEAILDKDGDRAEQLVIDIITIGKNTLHI